MLAEGLKPTKITERLVGDALEPPQHTKSAINDLYLSLHTLLLLVAEAVVLEDTARQQTDRSYR